MAFERFGGTSRGSKFKTPEKPKILARGQTFWDYVITPQGAPMHQKLAKSIF